MDPPQTSVRFAQFSDLAELDWDVCKTQEDRRKLMMACTKPAVDDKGTPIVRNADLVMTMPLWKDILASVLLLATFPGCFVWVPIVTMLLAYMLSEISLYFMLPVLVGALGVLAAVPLPKSWPPSALKFESMWKLLFQYFSFRGVWDIDSLLPDGGPYIFVAPPHGVFPFGNVLAIPAFQYGFGFTFSGMAASIILRTPVVRHIAAWFGASDAGWNSAKKNLGNGLSLGLSTGGIAEIFHAGDEDETIILRQRKGFVALAMVTGAEIVPCYLFGNTKCLKAYADRGGVLKSLSRRLRVSVTFFWGRHGLPLPYRTPIMGVMGTPIKIPKVFGDDGKPDRAVVDEYHAKVVDAVADIFEKYKESYGWGHKKLKIV